MTVAVCHSTVNSHYVESQEEQDKVRGTEKLKMSNFIKTSNNFKQFEYQLKLQ